MLNINKLTILFVSILLANELKAQSLIAGIPSADVAPVGKIMFTHESQVNFWKYEKIKWNSFNFMCYGVQKNLEFTVSFSNLSNSPKSHESLGIGFKKIFDIPVHIPETKIIFGQNVLFGTEKNPTVGGWSYAMFSCRTPNLKSRLTLGVSFGSAELFGFDTMTVKEGNNLVMKETRRNPVSIIAGFEQPIIKDKFFIIADWFSGRHDLSALITGVQLNLKHMVLIGGYKFMNYEKASTGSIIFETMYEF